MAVTKRLRKVDGKKKTDFQAEVWVAGVRIASQRFDTAASAHNWHDLTKNAYLNPVAPVPAVKGPLTFDEVLRSYQESSDFQNLRHSAQQTRGQRFVHFQNCPISNTLMTNFDAESIDAWLDWVITTPTANRPGRKSFHHEMKVLSVILHWYRNEKDPTFVVQIVKRHWKKTKYKKVLKRRPDFFIPPEDIQVWLEQMKTHSAYQYFALAKFMVLTGARLGEAAGLHWDSIDINRRTATIRQTLSWDYSTREPYLQEGEAKNEESLRILKLPTELAVLLSEMKVSARNEKVFCRNDGGYLKDSNVRSAFNKAFKATNLSWTATRILRHTFATWNLEASDGNLMPVQIAMGHKKRETTEIYAKATSALRSEMAEKSARVMLDKVHVKNHVKAASEERIQ